MKNTQNIYNGCVDDSNEGDDEDGAPLWEASDWKRNRQGSHEYKL